ncbi:hypothetical protein [Leisingera sp. ANG-DT]|uniref:hypothetical protein n=1 Tax=Leisingera sp. ANG-DT TaxID=1577897 RepID=UPI0019D3A3B0|nr:hypothetical protein [Leisingera sp. ANG-DT]
MKFRVGHGATRKKRNGDYNQNGGHDTPGMAQWNDLEVFRIEMRTVGLDIG